jgi:hypothetical protein
MPGNEKFAKQVGPEKTNAVCVRGMVHAEMSDLARIATSNWMY